MYTGGKKIGEGRLERAVPVAFSSFDGLDVGLDRGEPVDFTYKPPFTFSGSRRRRRPDTRLAAQSPNPYLWRLSMSWDILHH
jgi:arylsulfatase